MGRLKEFDEAKAIDGAVDCFWARGYDIFDGNLRQLGVFGMAVWALTFLTLMLFGFRWLFKPMAIFLLILSSVTSYYMDTLGIVIDREMIQNAMLTTVTESKHLITFNFIMHVLIWGVLPSAAFLWMRLRPMRRSARRRRARDGSTPPGGTRTAALRRMRGCCSAIRR